MEQNTKSSNQEKLLSEKESIEVLAEKLLLDFPLQRAEAIFFAIIGYMQKNGIPVSPSAVRKKFKELLVLPNKAEGKKLEDLVSLVFSLHGTSVAPWIPFLWKDSAFNDEIFTVEGNHLYNDAALFFKSDPDAVSVVRQAIEIKSPLCLVVCEFMEEASSQIVGKLLENEGIPVLLARNAQTETEYLEAALQAHHLKGIALFPNDSPEGCINFLKAVEKFGLHFCIVREYDENKDKTKEIIEEMRTHPPIQQIPSVTYRPSHVYGDILVERAGSYFNNNSEFLRILTTSKVNTATICTSKKLLNYMTENENWEGIRKYLSSASKLDITADMAKTRQVLSDSYDVDVLNMDINPKMIERMAQKAMERHQPFRIAECGSSGTGKTAFAHWLAKQLDMELIVKTVSDIQKVYIGESEAAIRNAFYEAEEKNAILLLDECETYMGKRTDSSASGGKSYNSMTNCFLTEIERFSGILICTTNRRDLIDDAFYRRLHRIVTFRFPTEYGMRRLFERYFPDIQFDEGELDNTCRRGFIGPGDFAILKESMEYMDEEEITPDFILEALHRNAELRNPSSDNVQIGFH